MNAKKAKALRKTAKVFASSNPNETELQYVTKGSQVVVAPNTPRWFYKQLKKSDL